MKKIWNCFEVYKKQVLLCFIATLAEAIFFLMIPTFMSQLFDIGLGNQDKLYIYQKGGVMILFAVVAMLIGIYENHLSAIAAQGLGLNLREALFNKIIDFSAANIDQFTGSSLITRLNSDVNAVQAGALQFMRMIFVGGWRIVIALILAVRINAGLTWIIVLTIVVFLAFLIIAMRLVMPWFLAMQEEVDVLNKYTQDNTKSQRVVKAFVREQYEEEKFNKPNSQLTEILGKANGILMSIVPFSAIVMNATIAAVLWFGGKQTGYGRMGFGELNTFFSYAMQVCAAIGMVSICAGQLGKALTAASRIFEVLDTPSVIQNSITKDTLVPQSSEIQFDHVSFRYTDKHTNPALDKINLVVPSGQILAIIGSTGEGKSSLINLVARLYDADEGVVRVGGYDVKKYSLETLRENIAYVPQNNILFSGTIRENIKWGNPGASEEEIVSACIAAQAHEFITSLENGYDTWIEQGGSNVSGGQRQRICIARALVKQASILLLDDSTSALDATTEAKVRDSLRTSYTNTTILLVAQKISSIKEADAILVLDRGQISGLGTHEELLKNNKIYQEIYHSQIKEVA